jgi:aminopeptidase N
LRSLLCFIILLRLTVIVFIILAVFRKDKKFALPQAPKQYSPDRTCKAKHYALDLRIFLEEKKIQGSVEITLIPFHERVQQIKIDGIELQIHRLSWEGQEWPYSSDSTALYLSFPTPLDPQKEYLLKIEYETRPQKGLYFMKADTDHPAAQTSNVVSRPRY